MSRIRTGLGFWVWGLGLRFRVLGLGVLPCSPAGLGQGVMLGGSRAMGWIGFGFTILSKAIVNACSDVERHVC